MQRTWSQVLHTHEGAGGLKVQSLHQSLPASTEGLSWVAQQEATFRALAVNPQPYPNPPQQLRSFSTHGHLSAAKGSSSTSHALTSV
jgi:hypothetical protein